MSFRAPRIAAWALGAALVLASPAARAQVVQVVSGGTSFGPGSCGDTTQPGVVDAAINLSYQYTQPPSAVYGVIGTPTVQLFATSDASCPTPGTTDSSVSPPSGSVILVASGTAADANAHNVSMHVSQLAAAGGGCAKPQTTAWQVCFYEFYQTEISPYTGPQAGNATATATLTYDSQPPGAPTINDVTPGDEHLRIHFTSPGDSDIANFEILIAPSGTATPAGASSTSAGSTSSSSTSTSSGSSSGSSSSTGTTTGGSSGSTGTTSSGSSGSTTGSSATTTTTTTGSTGSSATSSSSGAGGGYACMNVPVVAQPGSGDTDSLVPSNGSTLVNGQLYDIQIRAVDQSGNTGPCSQVATGTPQRIDDFWRLYKKSGGADSGGCSGAGGGLALFALLASVLLLARAARKD